MQDAQDILAEEQVILVDAQDTPLGTSPKLAAHQQGLLHRAISVFIFNTKGELLLQQRAFDKYHSAGLWTNTCCSHPRAGETTLEAAHRRLMEEMGLSTTLSFKFSFLYFAALEKDLIEHELDHVFCGITDDLPTPNPLEAATYKYISLENLSEELKQNPENFTAWFKIIFDQYAQKIIESRHIN